MLWGGAAEAAVNGYQVTWLDSLAPNNWYVATAINDQGLVAGAADIGGVTRAVVWDVGARAPRTIGGPTGIWVSDINNLGQVVGSSGSASSSSSLRGVVINAATGLVENVSGGAPQSINDAGQMAGIRIDANGNQRAASWASPSAAASKLDQGVTFSYASGINSSGQVAGTVQTGPESNEQHAVIWQNGQMKDLSASSGGWNQVNGINDAGEVAGYRQDVDAQGNTIGYVHATLWRNGSLVDLGQNMGRSDTNSFASAINERKQIVGSAGANDYNINVYVTHGILWDDEHPIDLNDFLSASDVAAGWVIQSAQDINEQGVILASAINQKTWVGDKYLLLKPVDTGYVKHEFRALAVPEPATSVTMLLGLGALAWVSRGRNRNKAA